MLFKPFHLPLDANRVYGLDVLRAFAILTVVLGHTTDCLPAAWLPCLNWLLYDGVTVFFVLSGFLIGGILIKMLEKRPATGPVLLEFWAKRWLRTVPPYFLVLALVLLVSRAAGDPLATWRNGVKYALFLQNFRVPQPNFFLESWSLAVEEWFYLLVPTAIFACIRLARLTPKQAVLTAALSVLVLVTLYRYYKFLHVPPHSIDEWDGQYRKVVVTRLDSLMYGVVGAYCARYLRPQWERYKNWALVPGLVLIALFRATVYLQPDGVALSVFSFSMTALGTLLVLPYASAWKTGRGVFAQGLTHISLISYSLYLLHGTLIRWHLVEPLRQAYQLPAWLAFVLIWTISIILATLMYKYFEVPCMRLRNRLFAPRIPVHSATTA